MNRIINMSTTTTTTGTKRTKRTCCAWARCGRTRRQAIT